MNRTRQHSARRERGAALIVAIGVLTLLLVVALTFFRASIGDVQTARNTVDGVRAELLADGATAVAIGFLNHDRFIHPTYTSLDTAWKTYFNGTAFAGKPYLWAPLADDTLAPSDTNYVHRMSPLRGGIVEIDPRLTSPAAPTDSLYIPRWDFRVYTTGLGQNVLPQDYVTADPDTDELQNPFVITADLADPTDPRKFPPFAEMFDRLTLEMTTQGYPSPIQLADYLALETTVYDSIAPNGRLISLRDPVINAQGMAIATNETLPYEQIHYITDVDSDGDGLNDAVWLPVGADRYFPDDGLDNDLDGFRDALGADGAPDTGDEDIDGEPGVFLYRGHLDGIDNDNDGIVDEYDPDNLYDPAGEYRYVIFTVPMPWRVDLDGNGTLDRLIPTGAELARMGITGQDIVLFEGETDINGAYVQPVGYGRTGNFIYARDNDYDLVLDGPVDASHYMLTPAVIAAITDPVNGCLDDFSCIPYGSLLRRMFAPDPDTNPGDNAILFNVDGSLALLGVIHGETMTELTGRMAILITDESSKVNINAAGGWQYPIFPDPLNPPSAGGGPLLALISTDANINISPFQRAFSDGIGPHEFDTRVLPEIQAISSNSGIGAQRARWMWQYLMGARQGFFAQAFPANDFFDLGYHTFDLEGDATLPGYGYVDDNANLLQVALSRTNHRGAPNYVIDPLVFRDPTFDLGLELGKWDGIDEPGEYQPFRPLRNLVTEATNNDDDGDDVVDEIGELGDQFFRTTQQLKLISAGTFGGNLGVRGLDDQDVFDAMRNLVTAHSNDRNERHFHQDSALASYIDVQNRQTTGQRKDLNLTRAGDVARTVKRDWTFQANLAEEWSVFNGALTVRQAVLTNASFSDFLRGLRQENVSVLSNERIMNFEPAAGRVFALLADAELRLHQEAATLKDYADLDYTRSLDDQIFTEDEWWQGLAEPFESDPDPVVATAAALAQSQRIYYTTAGLEAIRINEVMVRPVRRFEAEAITDLDATDPIPAVGVRGLDPNRFVPHGGVYPPVNQLAAEAIEEEGFRMRVATTTDAVNDYNARVGQNFNVVSSNGIEASDVAPVGQRWDPRPLRRFNGTVAVDAGLLGLEAAWATYRRYLTLEDPDVDDDRFTVPDVVQFSIQATDSLPAGRYYLTVNTQYVEEANGQLRNSVGDADDFLFAIKTGTLEQDWFADVMNIDAYVNSGQIYNQAWRAPALLGSAALGGSDGMAFLQGDASFRFDPLVPAGNIYTTTLNGFAQNNILDDRNLGFTVEVPERTGAATPEEDLWIHIAFRRGIGTEDSRGFVVNYLEFSQEPDHEWIEIVNQSDDVVDLSGWQVAVEAHPLGIGPMTIPANTFIAPRGMLLLGTNKFDLGYNVDPVTGDPILLEGAGDSPFDRDLYDRGIGFFVNGIGLVAADVAGPGAGVLAGVSVPQTFPDDTLFSFVDGIFYRAGATPVDFVDRDGDGFEDAAPQLRPDDDWISTVDPESIWGAPQVETKAWDRIVELIIPDLVPQIPGTNFDASDVGRIVLGGGIFPNRPEFDATDNDGDNRYLLFDGVDNDGDGDIDEAGEGFNEGAFFWDRHLRAREPVPGAYHQGTTPYDTYFDDVALRDFWTGGVDINGLATPNPPQWKEFLERRNFPGDNVVVTLYEGPASAARVADRITYSQRDVDNRQIDDVIFVTDFDNDVVGGATPFADVALGDPGVQLPLDDRFQSFWPENTMGQDFARSLERKHPDYTGDRFGTQNRFQATDGNYDDWSDSTGRWERILSFSPAGVFTETAMLDRIGFPAFSHALSGTPLRRNVPARIAEHTTADFTQFPPPERATTFAAVNFRNRPLVSPGDALTMPHTSRLQVLSPETENPTTLEQFLIDLSSPNISLAGGGPVGRGDSSYDTVMFGQRFDDSPVRNAINFFHDVRAIVGDTGTTDAVSLNVGQATVIQVARPGLPSNPAEDWEVVSGNLTGRPPQTWAPLMMFELTGTTGIDDSGFVTPYNYQRQYLFQPPTSLPSTVDTTRWPMPLRTAVYASRNFSNFAPGDPLDGAQAVFVWDGDDGLENGEYDLYVVTTEDLSLLSRAHANVAGGILTDPSLTGIDAGVGLPFVAATQATANNEVFLDIEVFRDSNGDRTAWTDGDGDGFISDNNTGINEFLHRGQDLNLNGIPDVPFESFGVLRNVQPDADGVVRYGNIRVENNFLAVSIRNRSASGTVARISRVVLTARAKTPGRININTVETKRIDLIADPLEQNRNFYNPLTGLPGMLRLPDPPNRDSDGIGPANMFVDSAGFDLTDEAANLPTPDDFAVGLARSIVEQRLRLLREQPDGRYYELTSDLLADAHFARVAEHPSPLLTGVALHAPLIVEYDHYLPDVDDDGVVDVDAIRAGALREAAFRFGKMQNLITVKGEVFEIIVTVQAGYGTDANGDGRINWRDDREFTAMAEKRARTIYER